MFSGSIVALVTPMTAAGAVHWDQLDALVDWHLASGTNGIVPVGTTGESATLAIDEHLRVIDAVVKRAAGRIPVLAGTGGNATAEAIHLTRAAEATGADGSLLVTPYYNRPTQAGLVAHYEAIAAQTSGPLVLYNVPPRTACDMTPDTVARLAQVDRIVGIKEASGDATRTGQILERTNAAGNDDFFVLSGEDGQTLRMLEQGAIGTISVTANVLPAQMAAFCAAFAGGDFSAARQLDAQLQPVHAAMFIESSPSPVKWALHSMGRIDAGIRLPLLPLSAGSQPQVRAALAALEAL